MQQYPCGRLFNLFLDPKETHSYLIRKFVHIELIQRAIADHLRTFRDYPAKPSPMRER